jgi:hypothetical protein
MILSFTSVYCVQNWGSDHGQCWFYFSRLFVTDPPILFCAALCASSMITGEPFCFFRRNWGHGQLVALISCLPLCRDGIRWGKNTFCPLNSTNRCSDPAPLVSDRTAHACLPDVDALYSREPQLKCRASHVIASDGFSLCLIWSLPLVLCSCLLMIIACDVDNTWCADWASAYCPWGVRYILLHPALVIVVCLHCLWTQAIRFWF